MYSLRKVSRSWCMAQLRRYRVICVILSTIGIVFNTVRVSVISVYLHNKFFVSHKGLETSNGNFLFGIFSIFLGIISWLVEMVLVASVVKRVDEGLRLWMGISVIIVFASSVSLISTSIMVGINSIALSFLFDLIRVICQFYVVTKTVPILRVKVIEDNTYVSAYDHMDEL